jgi:hypothetical protein
LAPNHHQVRQPLRPTSRRAGILVLSLLAAVVATISPVPAVTPDPVLVGAGDIASCTNRSGADATAALLDHIPGTVFTLGDNVYVDGTADEVAGCYDPAWGRHKARTAFPGAGNHDYNTPGAAGYYGYFGAAAGDPARGYHDAMLGAWHVIVLNSSCEFVAGGCGAGSPQERWLRSVLASSHAACTVALWHEPVFSSGTPHRAFPIYEPFWQALHDYGADVVLVASDHLYERFALQTPAGAADPRYGLRQFTVGTGGRSHQPLQSPAPNSEVRNGDTYGVLALTLHAGSYDWRFVPEAGRTFTDSGTAACHGAPPPPPPDPGPVTRVGTSSNGSKAPSASLTLARPAGTKRGHVMVASVVSDQAQPAFSAPRDWAVVRDDAVPGLLRQTVYVKVAGRSEPSSYIWKLAGSHHVTGGITSYAGVDTRHPVDASSVAADPVPGTAVTAPSLTTTVAGTRLVLLTGVNAEGTMIPPDGMTPRWVDAAPTGGTADALASSSDTTWPTAGVTGPRTATATEPGARIGVLLALRPAPARD